MVSRLLSQKRLQEINLEMINIDPTIVNRANLQQLDIWVDQYNHSIDPQQGIASSQLLSLLLFEEITQEMVKNALKRMEPEQKQQLQQLLVPSIDLQDVSTIEDAMTIIVMSTVISDNPQFQRLQNLTLNPQLTSSKNWGQIKDTIKSLTEFQKLFYSYQKYTSLEDQLLYLLEQVSDPIIEQALLQTSDLVREQNKFRGDGGGEVELPHYEPYYPEAYSQDREWMPRVILLAKHCKVWLYQLSRKYNMEIRHLNQIPDQELKIIVENGFTSLWLIGLWERSKASRIIKKRMGNQEAGASAYALWDYTIATDLGGHQAYYELSERAGKLGLKLASDMVPNHTGIVSKWVLEHPDWFIQCPEPPFASYTFHSEDLSEHPQISIHLEDKYYSRQDAAVVFKRVDKRSNEIRYIYHGNDGTSIPWNDTAQLDFTKTVVRERVIQTILHVAKMFPIIRLDAAMVLTKEHFQRLWFPKPGTGGDIASRSRYSMNGEEFDLKVPREFWREVVDRINEEAPDTLLVAEAFWMLEGYFVRTLGVHRVYNSAFMHMLRDQKNKEYRELIKSTLLYDPRILQRYVNFMSNPDEDSSIEQFGDGSKYFGITMLMITLPGMPMFGHGQIEGYREKYGMEYQQDYWNETVNSQLVELHRELIFPLMRHRELFAGVNYFRLYDVRNEDGIVEDIYAFTNKYESEIFLVVYNNTMQQQSGWIHTSAPFNSEIIEFGTEQSLKTKFIDEIGDRQGSSFCIFANYYADQYYIRSITKLSEQGIFLELQGYQFQVFSNFTLVTGDEELYQLYRSLSGQYVPYDRIKQWFTPDQ